MEKKLVILLWIGSLLCLGSNATAQNVENFNVADVTTKPLSCWYFRDILDPPEAGVGQYTWGINSATPIEGSGSMRFTGVAQRDAYKSTNLMTPFYGIPGDTVSFKMRINATGVVAGTELAIGVWTGYSFSTPAYTYTVADNNTVIDINYVVPEEREGIISIEFRFYQWGGAGTPELNFTVDIDEFQTTAGIDPDNACYQSYLPVSFGNLSAGIADAQLTVNWNTLTETNNDHFDVEASADGKTFTKIGTVVSKATAGHSGNALSYEFTTPLNTAGALLGFSLMSLGALFFNKRNKKALLSAMLVGVVLLGISCSKSDTTPLDSKSKWYVRIAQVDKDGKKAYSKTVQVFIQ